jgi:hypothetical protein
MNTRTEPGRPGLVLRVAAGLAAAGLAGVIVLLLIGGGLARLWQRP